MKVTYKGCEIEVTREKCLGGWDTIYFNVFDDGFEVTFGFSETTDTVRGVIKDMKKIVDEYREHPEYYE